MTFINIVWSVVSLSFSSVSGSPVETRVSWTSAVLSKGETFNFTRIWCAGEERGGYDWEMTEIITTVTWLNFHKHNLPRNVPCNFRNGQIIVMHIAGFCKGFYSEKCAYCSLKLPNVNVLYMKTHKNTHYSTGLKRWLGDRLSLDLAGEMLLSHCFLINQFGGKCHWRDHHSWCTLLPRISRNWSRGIQWVDRSYSMNSCRRAAPSCGHKSHSHTLESRWKLTTQADSPNLSRITCVG